MLRSSSNTVSGVLMTAIGGDLGGRGRRGGTMPLGFSGNNCDVVRMLQSLCGLPGDMDLPISGLLSTGFSWY